MERIHLDGWYSVTSAQAQGLGLLLSNLSRLLADYDLGQLLLPARDRKHVDSLFNVIDNQLSAQHNRTLIGCEPEGRPL